MSAVNIDKITFEHTDVWGFDHSMRGMRNAMNSWQKNDTVTDRKDGFVFVGENDMNLVTNLCKAGPEHRKNLRMIHVAVDMTLPRYIWSEMDTYHFNVKCSTSTMHKLLNNKEPISPSQFIYDTEDGELYTLIFATLEKMRQEYMESDTTMERKLQLIARAKRLLPDGFLQKRTFDTNYEELKNIYRQRKNHRLKLEWGAVCHWIETLPYAKELILS